MKSWQIDKKWSDKFLPEIKRILVKNAGAFLEVAIAPDEDDQEKATDLIVTVDSGQVAVRIRRDGYNKKYRDWTIRSYRTSGQKTELEKLQSGFARWYLYLWTEQDSVNDWILVDLDKARISGLLFKQRHQISNNDGTYFIAISISEIKRYGCLVSEFSKVDTYQPPLFSTI